MPRPLAIDVGEVADPVFVPFTDAQRAGCLVAELETPAGIVAEAHHVGHVGRLIRRRSLLLAGRIGAILPERTVLGEGRASGPQQRDGENRAQECDGHGGLREEMIVAGWVFCCVRNCWPLRGARDVLGGRVSRLRRWLQIRPGRFATRFTRRVQATGPRAYNNLPLGFRRRASGTPNWVRVSRNAKLPIHLMP